MQKLYYAYVGQNASYGEPNKTTGRYSMYGDILSFSTKEKRDRFVDEFYDQSNPSVFAKACSRTSARQYNLGMTMFDFDQYMDFTVRGWVDDHYNSYFGEQNG